MAEIQLLPQLQSPIYPPLPPDEQRRVDDQMRNITDISQLTGARIKFIQSIIGARAVLNRPQLSPGYYAVIRHFPTGVEFDAMIRCLVIKPISVLRELITGVVLEWMKGLAPHVRDPQHTTASKHEEVWLSSWYALSTRHVECAIHPPRPTVDASPVVTFELGINETTKGLLQGVMRLFQGECSFLKLAIVLNVKQLYSSSRDGPPPLITRRERLDSKVFEAVIYLVYKDLPPQHAWRCVFGSERVYSRDPHNLFIPLRRINWGLEYDMLENDYFPPRHDNEVELPFPVDQIIKLLQHRAKYDDSRYLSSWQAKIDYRAVGPSSFDETVPPKKSRIARPKGNRRPAAQLSIRM